MNEVGLECNPQLFDGPNVGFAQANACIQTGRHKHATRDAQIVHCSSLAEDLIMQSRSISSVLSVVAACVLVSGLGTANMAMAAGGKGYTTSVYHHDPVLGVDKVGHFSIGNPYVGDTSCSAKRPVLCVKVDGSARPPYPITAATGSAFYNGWVEGHLARTKPVKGTLLTSLAAADSQCSSSFGAGWRMAEFHDGKYIPGMDDSNFYYSAPYSPSPWSSGAAAPGGHGMYGYGNLGTDTRFWTYVNDQPANCWNP